MLLYLTNYLAQFESAFNVFNYLTMRAILGALTALVLSFVIGPKMIARLSVNQVRIRSVTANRLTNLVNAEAGKNCSGNRRRRSLPP